MSVLRAIFAVLLTTAWICSTASAAANTIPCAAEKSRMDKACSSVDSICSQADQATDIQSKARMTTTCVAARAFCLEQSFPNRACLNKLAVTPPLSGAPNSEIEQCLHAAEVSTGPVFEAKKACFDSWISSHSAH